jgi:hypothetical protein
VEKLTPNKKEPVVISYRPEGDYTSNNTSLSSTSPCVKGKGLEAGHLFHRVYQVKGVARKFYFLSDSADWLTLSGKELKQALEKSREWPSTEDKDAFFGELKHHVAEFNQLGFAFNQLPGMEQGIHWLRLRPSGQVIRVLVRQGGQVS